MNYQEKKQLTELRVAVSQNYVRSVFVTMRANVRRKWYWTTHFKVMHDFDKPMHLGNGYEVSGMMITGQKRWYRRTLRILWGQQAKDKWW